MENIKIFSLIQLFDIPIIIMEGFPYISVFIFPFFVLDLNKKNIIIRILFSNIRHSFIILFLIFIVLLFGVSVFFIKEKFAYSWKNKARALYDLNKNTITNYPIDYFMSVEGIFIVLPAHAVFFYNKMNIRYGKKAFHKIILDSLNNEEVLIAENAGLTDRNIFFERGKIVKLDASSQKINIISFNQYLIQDFYDSQTIFLKSTELKYLNTNMIWHLLESSDKYEERIKKFIRNVIIERIMPNFFGIIFILIQGFVFLFFFRKYRFNMMLIINLILSTFGLFLIFGSLFFIL